MYNGPIIDTHAHLWNLKQFNLPWLDYTGFETINRSYLLADYQQACKDLNIEKSVYIEVDLAKDQQAQEADFAIKLCESNDNTFSAAVIAGDLTDPNFPQYIKSYASNPFIKGVRMVLIMPNRKRGLCKQKTFIDNLQLLPKLGLHFEICIRAEEIADAVSVVQQCPETNFVIDHIACFYALSCGGAVYDNWLKGMKQLAASPNCVCKISGIIRTLVDKKNWTTDDLAPNILQAIAIFGHDRVMFGADWPPCIIVASLGTWVDELKKITRLFSDADQEKLFYSNAQRAYRLAAT